jgi:hypothetical protein
MQSALRQTVTQGPESWSFRLPQPAPNVLDAELFFSFFDQPQIDLSIRFSDAEVVIQSGRGDPRDTIVGTVKSFLDFCENKRSAQGLFLEQDWQLGSGGGRGAQDLDELRDYVMELEQLLPAPYQMDAGLRERVRINSCRFGDNFDIVRRSNVTSQVFFEEFLQTGTPLIMRDAVATGWWSFDRLQEMFRGVSTHLCRYPQCSFAIDDCITRIVSGSPTAFKAALALTRDLRSQYLVENLFCADQVFQKAQKLLLAPANQHMSSSYRATAWHRDWADNLLTELIGSKRVLLTSPRYEDQFALRHVPACHYNVAVDYSELSGRECGSVPVLDVVLEPGDVLFIPCGWLHTVENVTATAAVNCWRVHPPELLSLEAH